jgi:hypothetical protein
MTLDWGRAGIVFDLVDNEWFQVSTLDDTEKSGVLLRNTAWQKKSRRSQLPSTLMLFGPHTGQSSQLFGDVNDGSVSVCRRVLAESIQ